MNWGRLIHQHGHLTPYRQTAGSPDYLPTGPVLDALDAVKVLQDSGDLDGAMAVLEETERLCREIGDRDGLAYTLNSQALILQERGELHRATALHQEAQYVYGELANRKGVVFSINNRAKIVQGRADFDGAMALYHEAESIYRGLGNRDRVALPLHDQARVLQEQRDLDGILELLALILFAYLAEPQRLHFEPFKSSGTYCLGEKAGWTVTLAEGAAGTAPKYTYEIKRNNLDEIKSGTLDFTSGSTTIEVTLEEPAMIYVTVSAEGSTPASAVHLGAAISPAQLKPSVSRPADFDAFWDAKLHGLGLIALDPLVTPVASPGGVELSTVRVQCWGSHTQGYLAKPAKPGKFPALVLFQHAGVYAMRPHAAVKRAAEGWLAFDVVAHDLPPHAAGNASRNYETIGNTDRETSYFLRMYLRGARAVDYITSRAEWDGKTLVLLGTCMGGQQALVTAALCPQVTAVIVNQPSGADSHGELHGRKAGYPYWPSKDPKVMATALYFDVVNFAPRIQAPVLASMGFIDTTSPPAGIWTVLNQIPGPKEVVTMIELDHTSRTPDQLGIFRSRASAVLDVLLHGGPFRPNQP